MNISKDSAKMTWSVYEQILSHARQEAPKECCGLLSGQRDIITRRHPMKNVLESEVQYSIDPKALFQFFKELRAAGLQHLGIYHSHLSSEAFPSQTDIEQAFYPDCIYLIISMKVPSAPVLRAFRITGQGVTEQELQIVSREMAG
jgi:proteasome lid subunit RPN8/RPN11